MFKSIKLECNIIISDFFLHMIEYSCYLQIVMRDIGNAGIIYDAFRSFTFAMERTIVEMAQMKTIVPEEVVISKEQRG